MTTSTPVAREPEHHQLYNLTAIAKDDWEDDAANCKLCQVQLGKRHLHPRHHCRVCGASVCAQCAPNRLELEGAKGTQRVCADCVLQVARLPHLRKQLVQIGQTMKKLCEEPVAEDSENTKEVEDVGPETLDAAVQYLTTRLPFLESATRANRLEREKGSDGGVDKEVEAQQLVNAELSLELDRERKLRESLESAAHVSKPVAKPVASGELPNSLAPTAHQQIVEGEWFLTPSVGTWLGQWPQEARTVERSVASTSPVQHPAVVGATPLAQQVSSVAQGPWFRRPSVGTWLHILPQPNQGGSSDTLALAKEKAHEAELESELASERRLRSSLEAPEMCQVENELAAQRRLRENLEHSSAQELQESAMEQMQHDRVLQKCKDSTTTQETRNAKMSAELAQLRSDIEKKKKTSGCSVQ